MSDIKISGAAEKIKGYGNVDRSIGRSSEILREIQMLSEESKNSMKIKSQVKKSQSPYAEDRRSEEGNQLLSSAVEGAWRYVSEPGPSEQYPLAVYNIKKLDIL